MLFRSAVSESVALSSFSAPSVVPTPVAPSHTGGPGTFPGETVLLADFPMTFTAKALEMIGSALEETHGEDGNFLRVGVKGGGCSGFQYSLNFTDEVDEEDLLVLVDSASKQAVQIVTDAFSASYLKGTELDYVDTLQGAGFKFNNPNAKRTCGCGSSFSA